MPRLTRIVHPLSVIVTTLLVVSSIVCANDQASTPGNSRPRAVLPLDENAWRDSAPGMPPPGSRYALISGNPAWAEPFTMRVELPPGYLVAPYSRPADEVLVVLAGTLMIGHGSRFDRSSLRTLPTGSFAEWIPSHAAVLERLIGATRAAPSYCPGTVGVRSYTRCRGEAAALFCLFPFPALATDVVRGASHVVMVSNPEAVAKMIELAATISP